MSEFEKTLDTCIIVMEIEINGDVIVIGTMAVITSYSIHYTKLYDFSRSKAAFSTVSFGGRPKGGPEIRMPWFLQNVRFARVR